MSFLNWDTVPSSINTDMSQSSFLFSGAAWATRRAVMTQFGSQESCLCFSHCQIGHGEAEKETKRCSWFITASAKRKISLYLQVRKWDTFHPSHLSALSIYIVECDWLGKIRVQKKKKIATLKGLKHVYSIYTRTQTELETKCQHL